MIRALQLLVIISISSMMFSCKKSMIGNGDTQAPDRVSILIGNNWGFKSIHSIDSLSNGVLTNYKGATSDTLLFLYGINPNLYVYGIYSNINGASSQIGISNIFTCSSALPSDTTKIAYDTIVCTSGFRPNYSDTLFLLKVSNSTLIFKVRYFTPNGKGVELDSLYRLSYRN